MTVQELHDKTEGELQAMLAQARQDVRKLRFGIAMREVKDNSAVSKHKKLIARIMTLLSSRKRALK